MVQQCRTRGSWTSVIAVIDIVVVAIIKIKNLISCASVATVRVNSVSRTGVNRPTSNECSIGSFVRRTISHINELASVSMNYVKFAVSLVDSLCRLLSVWNVNLKIFLCGWCFAKNAGVWNKICTHYLRYWDNQ